MKKKSEKVKELEGFVQKMNNNEFVHDSIIFSKKNLEKKEKKELISIIIKLHEENIDLENNYYECQEQNEMNKS